MLFIVFALAERKNDKQLENKVSLCRRQGFSDVTT